MSTRPRDGRSGPGDRVGVGWDATAVVDRALGYLDGRAAAPAGPGDRVLKRGVRGVVWLEGAGPTGEAVVVKTVEARGLGSRLAERLLGSAAERHRRAADALLAQGIRTPVPLATDERRGPRGRRSSVVSRAVVEGERLKPLFVRLGARDRRRCARALGRFVARLHETRTYVPDLRDANLLVVSEGDGGFGFVIVDLDRVRRTRRPLSERRRRANLIQLDRTIGWVALERERLACLAAYRRALPAPRPPLRALASALDEARSKKDRSVAMRRRRAGIVPDDRMEISCIIITGNEIAHIRECLDSVRWCDQVVVVDSFSTDGTYEICREHATSVVRRAWTGYRDQKAFALAQARHPWILNVDADERVSPELRAEIAEILTSDGRGYDGFTVPRLVRYLGRWWRVGGWYPDRRLRLFRRERASWGGRDPHEHVILRGRIGQLYGPLLHYTYDDVADHVATINRFTTIATAEGARRVSWAELWLRPLARLVRFYLLRLGFRMGFPGLFAAISAGVYVHLKYAKRDEAARAAAEEAAWR
jgi:tRNA A-37 threonylcarbamoyl transferase component Bud32